MVAELRDLLKRGAGEARELPDVPSAWRKGRRIVWRRRAGVALVAAAAVVVTSTTQLTDRAMDLFSSRPIPPGHQDGEVRPGPPQLPSDPGTRLPAFLLGTYTAKNDRLAGFVDAGRSGPASDTVVLSFLPARHRVCRALALGGRCFVFRTKSARSDENTPRGRATWRSNNVIVLRYDARSLRFLPPRCTDAVDQLTFEGYTADGITLRGYPGNCIPNSALGNFRRVR